MEILDLQSLEALRDRLDKRLAYYRSLHRLVMSGEFGEFWASCSPEVKTQIVEALLTDNKDRLSQLLKHHRDMSEYSVKQLRSMCRMRNIKNYHLMTKAELLSCLTKNL